MRASMGVFIAVSRTVHGRVMSSVFRRECPALGTVIRRFFQKTNHGIQFTGMRETAIPRADDPPCLFSEPIRLSNVCMLYSTLGYSTKRQSYSTVLCMIFEVTIFASLNGSTKTFPKNNEPHDWINDASY